jgi:hypothetical protein
MMQKKVSNSCPFFKQVSGFAVLVVVRVIERHRRKKRNRQRIGVSTATNAKVTGGCFAEDQCLSSSHLQKEFGYKVSRWRAAPSERHQHCMGGLRVRLSSSFGMFEILR